MNSSVCKVFWFTGLSGSGKSTLASAIQSHLKTLNITSVILDGDEIREGLNKNLTFSIADRFENIRRIAEVSKILIQNNIVVIVATISPLISMRNLARNIIGDQVFREIYVNASLQTCEKRDVKGLYKQVREGLIENFTGVSSTYEVPHSDYFEINTEENDLDYSIKKLTRYINTELNVSFKQFNTT